jgi:hypothetical protein
MTAAATVKPGHVCANCGATAPDRYCPACGQATRERLPTFAQFMRDATGRYLSYDGKLWKTLFLLLFRPGYLTRAYLEGRRKRFIGPARLFLISSVVLFAVLRFATESMEITSVIPDETSAPASRKQSTPKAPADESGILIDDELNLNLPDLPDSAGPLKRRLDHFNRLPRAQKIEQVVAGALRYGPYAMFTLLPAFAALLKVLYLGRRRRYPGRPRLYGEHLVFAAHNHAFLFVAGTLLLALPVDVGRPVITLWAIFYLAWSMHRVYGGSWSGIAARGFVMFVLYAVLFSLVTMGLLVVAVLWR